MIGRTGLRAWAMVGTVCACLVAAILAAAPGEFRSLAILPVIGVVVAAARFAPLAAGSLIARGRHFESLAAGRALQFGARRFAYVIAVLALAIALSIGLDGAAASLKTDVRKSVAAWTIGDLFLRPAQPGKSLHDEKFAPGTADALRDVPGVAAVGWFSYSTIELAGTRVPVWTWAADDVNRFVDFRVAEGPRGAELWDRLADGDIALSNNFARLHGIAVGDRVVLPTTTGAEPRVVAAIVDDSASDAGVVITGPATYTAITGDDRAQEIELLLDPRADPAQVAADVEARLRPGYPGLIVYDRAAIRASFATLAGDLLDSFVTVGRLLFLVAFLVGATATVTGLVARRRELGIVRLAGADHAVVRAQLVRESLAVATSAWAIGFPAGFLLVPVLLRGLASQTGVLPPPSWPWLAGLLSLPVSILLSLLALVLASPRRGRGPLVDVLVED